MPEHPLQLNRILFTNLVDDKEQGKKKYLIHKEVVEWE